MKNLKKTFKSKLSCLLITSSFLLLSHTISAQVWTLKTEIDNNLDSSSALDISLSSDGLSMAIGYPLNDSMGVQLGEVKVLKNTSGVWLPSGNSIYGDTIGSRFGRIVELNADGSKLAVSTLEYNLNRGNVKVYENIAGVWTQQGVTLIGDAQNDRFGWGLSLSASGSVIAIGAPYNIDGGSFAGQVKVFKLISGVWTQQGASLEGALSDLFGNDISLSADGLTLAVGAPGNGTNGNNAGQVKVFNFSSGSWIQQGADINGEAANDRSGVAVSLGDNGRVLAIGAPDNDGNGIRSGHVRVFEFVSGSWIQMGTDIDGDTIGMFSGADVSLSANGLILAVGESNFLGALAVPGLVKVYRYVSNAWKQEGATIMGKFSGEFAGSIVNLNADGTLVAFSAPSLPLLGFGMVRLYGSPFVGLEENGFGKDMKLYPNPTNEKIEISLGKFYNDVNVQVTNTIGQQIYSMNYGKTDRVFLELTGANGVYFIEITTSEKISARLKVVKE